MILRYSIYVLLALSALHSCGPLLTKDSDVEFYSEQLLIDADGNVISTFQNPYAGMHVITPTGNASYYYFPEVIKSKADIGIPMIFKSPTCIELAFIDHPEFGELSLVTYCKDGLVDLKKVTGYIDDYRNQMRKFNAIDGQYYIFRPTLSTIDPKTNSIVPYYDTENNVVEVYDMTFSNGIPYIIGNESIEWPKRDEYSIYILKNGELTNDNPINEFLKSSEEEYIIPEMIGSRGDNIYVLASTPDDDTVLFHFSAEGRIINKIDGLSFAFARQIYNPSKAYDKDGYFTFQIREKDNTQNIYRYNDSELEHVFSNTSCLDIPWMERAYCFDNKNQLYIHCELIDEAGQHNVILRYKDCTDYSYTKMSNDMWETSRSPVSEYLERLSR